MTHPSKISELISENRRLTTELSALKARHGASSADDTAAGTAEENKDSDAEVASLKEQLGAAEKSKAEAEQAKATAETAKAEAESRAEAAEKAKAAAEQAKATAEQAAETAKADAKAQIDAKEKSVGQRANQAAIDQMASVGQPPPDNKPAPAVQTHHKTNPNEGLSGLEIARRQWATHAN